MTTTVKNASFRRMREQSGALGFLSDFATLTASSAATGCAASNLQAFYGSGAGFVWRSTGDTAESLLFDFGSSVNLNWLHAEGAGSKGLRDVGADPVVVTLKADNSNPPTTTIGTATYSPTTGGWSLTFDTVSARYAKVFFDRAGGSPAWSYFQLARVALDSWETFDTNFGDNFSEAPENLSTSYEMAHGSHVTRYRRPRLVLQVPQPNLGAGSNDLELWNRFRGYVGEAESGFAPEAPLWFAPDPSGVLAGSAGLLAPRFCWVRSQQPLVNRSAAGRLYSTSLELVQVGR